MYRHYRSYLHQFGFHGDISFSLQLPIRTEWPFAQSGRGWQRAVVAAIARDGLPQQANAYVGWPTRREMCLHSLRRVGNVLVEM